MKFTLVVIMCSAMQSFCLPPVNIEQIYDDAYSCYTDGYQKSYNKIVEIGKEEVNKHRIFIKFNCYEVEINETSIPSQQFQKKVQSSYIR
jgi:hypothetical protein